MTVSTCTYYMLYRHMLISQIDCKLMAHLITPAFCALSFLVKVNSFPIATASTNSVSLDFSL